MNNQDQVILNKLESIIRDYEDVFNGIEYTTNLPLAKLLFPEYKNKSKLPNCYVLYRRDKYQAVGIECNITVQKDISKRVGEMWNHEESIYVKNFFMILSVINRLIYKEFNNEESLKPWELDAEVPNLFLSENALRSAVIEEKLPTFIEYEVNFMF